MKLSHLENIVVNRKNMNFPTFKKKINKEMDFCNLSYNQTIRKFEKLQNESENIVQYKHNYDMAMHIKKCSPCLINEFGIVTIKSGYAIGIIVGNELMIDQKYYQRVRKEIDKIFFIDYIVLT